MSDLGKRFHIKTTKGRYAGKQYDCHVYSSKEDIIDDYIKIKLNGSYAYVPISSEYTETRTPMAVVKNNIQKYVLTEDGYEICRLNHDQNRFEWIVPTVKVRNVAICNANTGEILFVVNVEPDCEYNTILNRYNSSRSEFKIYSSNTHQYDEYYINEVIESNKPISVRVSAKINKMKPTVTWYGEYYSDGS